MQKFNLYVSYQICNAQKCKGWPLAQPTLWWTFARHFQYQRPRYVKRRHGTSWQVAHSGRSSPRYLGMGALVWIPGHTLWKEVSLRGTRFESQTTGPQTTNLSMDHSASGNWWLGLCNPPNEGKDYTWLVLREKYCQLGEYMPPPITRTWKICWHSDGLGIYVYLGGGFQTPFKKSQVGSSPQLRVRF